MNPHLFKRHALRWVIMGWFLASVGLNGLPLVRFSGLFIANKNDPTPTLLNGTYQTDIQLNRTFSDVKWKFADSVVFKNGRFELLIPYPSSGNLTPPFGGVLPQDGFHFDYDDVSLTVYPLTGSRGSEAFKLFSYPFSVSTQVTDYALSARAEDIQLVAGDSVLSTSQVTVNHTTSVFKSGFLVTSKNVMMGVGGSGLYRLSVSGLINATGYYVNGIPLSDTLPWQSPIGARYIRSSLVYDRIGIGVKYPLSTLHVGRSGTVNATNFLIKGQPYTYANQWRSAVMGNDPTYVATVHVPDDVIGVGVGIYRPNERLELDGAVRLSSDLVRTHQDGVIQYGVLPSPLWPSRTRRDFQGRVASGNQLVWTTLLGYDREPRPNRLSYFKPIADSDTALPVMGSTGLEWSSTLQGLGLGITPEATFSLRPMASQSRVPLWSIINSQSGVPYTVFSIDSTGNVGIGTASPMYALDVDGIINVQDVYENDAPYRLSRSKGTYFQRNANSDIFYLHGNVGIGRPDPISRLDIAAINVERDTIQENPALSISMRSAGSVIRYTMGVDLASQETFRVEKGDTLGSRTPLFVAQRDRFGVGTDTPYANLTVSGNGGIIMGGGFPNGTLMDPFTSPSYFFWYPRKNVFRAMGSTVEQTELDMGLHSTAMGWESMAKGNFSMVMGGQNNRVEGAYATTVGGQNMVITDTSDFSLGLGTNVRIQHHGVWAWGDRNGAALSSQRDNQWLIRAGGGVGIGTNKTSIADAYGMNDRPISLAVGGGLVTPYLFLPGREGDIQYGVTAFLVDPTRNAQALVNDMVASGRLSSSGALLSFDPQAPFLYDTGPYSTNAEIKTILNRLVDRPIIRLIGQSQDRMVVYQSGAVVLGSGTADRPGLMLDGMVGVGTTAPQAHIHMVVPMSSGGVSLDRALVWVATMNSIPTQPVMVVDEYGNVGFRQVPDFRPYGSVLQDPNPEKKKHYLFASSLQVSSMDWWNGMTLSTGAFAGDPWMIRPLVGGIKPLVFPSANPVVHSGVLVIPRTGNVGVGTPSPNGLLTLSNRSSARNAVLLQPVRWPNLTFDWDGIDIMSVGRRPFLPNTLLVYPGGSGVDDTALGNTSLMITSAQVGIKTNPRSDVVLDVDGAMVLNPSANQTVSAFQIGSGPLVLPSPLPSLPLLLAVSRLDVSNFSVGGVLQDWADGLNGSVVRFSDLGGGLFSYTGIGRTDPAFDLDVRGTIRLDALVAASSTFSVVTASTPVGFLEAGEQAALLSVASDRLVVQYGSNQVDLSAVMTRGASVLGGSVGMFATDSASGLPPFSRTEMWWQPDRDDVMDAPGQWLVTGSMSLTKPSATRALSTQWVPSVNINAGFTHQVSLTRGPFLADSFGYRLTHTAATLSNIPDKGVVGWHVVVTFNPTARLSSGVLGVGLNVDLTQAMVQTVGVRGEKVAAVFMPVPGQPGVGIGTSYPKAALDVQGAMVADRFIIGSELSLVTMNVGTSFLDLTNASGVGIGFTSPKADLDINGAAQIVGRLRVRRGVVAPNLSMVTAPFIVANDLVGMGTTTPVSALHTQHLINAITPLSRTGFSYGVHVGAGNVFATQGLTGVNVRLRSIPDRFGYTTQPVNWLGLSPISTTKETPVAYGVRLNATALSLATTPLTVPPPLPSLTGLLVTLPNNEETRSRMIGATFLNGVGGVKVGIGLTNPSEALEVLGDIKVQSFDLSLVPTREFNTFGSKSMVVLGQMKVLGPMVLEAATVNRRVTADQLVILSPWDVPSLVLWPQTAALASLRVTDPVVTIATLNAWSGTLQVSVATVNRMGPLFDDAWSNEVAFRMGDAVLSSLRTIQSMTAPALFVPNRLSVANQKVGIGGDAGSLLHVRQLATSTYAPSTVGTWATLHLQHPTASLVAGAQMGSGVYATFSSGQGAGVLGYRTTTLVPSDRTDHALLFLTTALDSFPKESMRVLASGHVRMGFLPSLVMDLSLDSYALAVSGSATVSGVMGRQTSMIQVPVLSFNGAVGTVGVTTLLPTSDLKQSMTTPWLVLASQNTTLGTGLSHVTVAAPGGAFPAGAFVFTNALNQQANLGNEAFSGEANTLLFYHPTTGQLTNIPLKSVRVGTTEWRVTVNMTHNSSGVTSGIQMVSKPLAQSGAGLMVRATLAPRALLQEGVTMSVVSMVATGNGRGNTAGYRALAVDVSQVPTRSYNGLTLQYGVAHAALFQPGADAKNGWLLADRWSSVGLDQPAMIRIKGDSTLTDPLWTTESSGSNRGQLWVSKDISVALTDLGPRSTMESLFTPSLVGVLGDSDLLRIRDNAGTSLVLTGVGATPRLMVGVTEAGSEALQVNGTLKATETGMFGSVAMAALQYTEAQGIRILNPQSVLETSLGIGRSNPTYALEVAKRVTGASIGSVLDDQVLQKMKMGLAFDSYPGTVLVNGLDISMRVTSNSVVDNQVFFANGSSALLLGIDATKAVLTGQASVIGLSLRINPGSGKVAYLTGGRVGIGTMTPRTTLEVAGILSGASLYQSSLGNWQLDRSTINTLSVRTDVTVPSLTVGRSVSTNVLRILAANFELPATDTGDEFKVESVQSNTTSVNQLLVSNVHTIESPDVSRIGSSFPAFSLKGSVWADGTLTAGWVTLNQLMARDAIVVQGPVTLNHLLRTPMLTLGLLQLPNVNPRLIDAILDTEKALMVSTNALYVYDHATKGWLNLSTPQLTNGTPYKVGYYTDSAQLGSNQSVSVTGQGLALRGRLSARYAIPLNQSGTLMAQRWVNPMRLIDEQQYEWVGTKVVFDAINLADQDRVIGLRVSVDGTVLETSYLPDGRLVKGQKTVASFLGGVSWNVLIDPTTGTVRPMTSAAALWVRQPKSTKEGWLHVTLGNGATALQVTGNQVRTGGLLRMVDARWVAQAASGMPLMMVTGTNGGLVIVSDNKVAIATTNQRGTLTVPVIKGEKGVMSTLNVETAVRMGQAANPLVTWGPSQVGIGATIPSSLWAIQTPWRMPSDMATEPSTSMSVWGGLTGDQPFTGIRVAIQESGTLSWLDSSVLQGVVVDMRTLGGNADSRGILVRVPASKVAFQTKGRVGIGLTNPTDPLTVSGLVSMNALIVEGLMTVPVMTMVTAVMERVTFNQVSVGTVTGSVTLTVNQTVQYRALQYRTMTQPSADNLSVDLIRADALYVSANIGYNAIWPNMFSKAFWAAGNTRWQSVQMNSGVQASTWQLRALKAGELNFINRVSMNTVQQSRLSLKALTGSRLSRSLASDATLSAFLYRDSAGGDYDLLTIKSSASNHNKGAYYGSDARLAAVSNLSVLSGGGVMMVNGVIKATMNVAPSATGPLSAFGIRMGFTDRPAPSYDGTPSTSTLNGLLINMVLNDGSSAATDVVQGLKVDISNVAVDNSPPLPVLADTPIRAVRQAAVFMAASPGEREGGTVGIMAIPTMDITYARSVNATLTVHAAGTIEFKGTAIKSFPLFHVRKKANDMPLMQVSNNAWVINTHESNVRLAVSGDLRVGSASNGMRVAMGGQSIQWGIGWGDATPSASLHLGSDGVPFKVDEQALTVGEGGVVAINAPTKDATLFVSGNLLVTQWVGASGSSSKKFWRVVDQKIGVGLSSETLVPGADVAVSGTNQLLIGETAQSLLTGPSLTVGSSSCVLGMISNGLESNCPMVAGPYPLFWGTTPGVGIGTSNQSTTLLTIATQNGVLLTLKGSGSPVLEIHANGNVGVNTSSPTDPLSVVGNVSVGDLTSRSLVSANQITLSKQIVVSDTVVTQSKTLSMVSGVLAQDFNQLLVGLRVSVNATLSRSNETNMIGLWVTMNLETKDVSLANGPRTGRQLAAVFMGGPVIMNPLYSGGKSAQDLIDSFNNSERNHKGTYQSADGKALLMVASTWNAGIKLLTNNKGILKGILVGPMTTTRQPVYRLSDRLFQSKNGVTYTQSKDALGAARVAGKVFNPDANGQYLLSNSVSDLNVNGQLSLTQAQFQELVTALATPNGIMIAITTTNTGTSLNALLLSMGVAPGNNTGRAVRYPPGRVSVGTDKLGVDTALLVSGNMRVGVSNNRSVFGAAQAGGGPKWVFSGGEVLNEVDSTNTDTFEMLRYNRALQSSEFRIQVQDSDTASPNAMFVLGEIDNEPLSSTFTGLVVQHTGYVDPSDAAKAKKNGQDVTYTPGGRVGIGTTQPRAVFEVKHSGLDAANPAMTDHIVGLVGLNGTDVLALRGYPGANSTFINMISSVKADDGIEVPSVSARFRYNVLNTGVTFEGMSADYAEYVPRGVASTPQPGEVVSVDRGRTQYQTDGQGILMVISDRPIVVGNWQEGHVSADMVSFMGQVDVKVVGMVRPGDYLVPSGAHDGRAKAMPWDQVLADQVVGVAMTSVNPDTRTVRAMVGLPYKNQVLARQLMGLAAIREEAQALTQRTLEWRAQVMPQLDALEARMDGPRDTP